MLSHVFLDTGVLSLVVDKPGKSPTVTSVQNWLVTLLSAGVRVYVPEICDYELRRELVRSRKISSVRRLDTLVSSVQYIPVTTAILRQAADLWANARNSGNQTANDAALDGDIILCAQVLSLGLTNAEYVVATTNTKHLRLFVNAGEWQNIAL